MNSEQISALVNFGAAGAIIVVVVYFLNFIGKRDEEWRNFFTAIRQTDGQSAQKLADAIERLVCRIENLENKFDQHDATEMEFLRGVAARDRNKTQPRKS